MSILRKLRENLLGVEYDDEYDEYDEYEDEYVEDYPPQKENSRLKDIDYRNKDNILSIGKNTSSTKRPSTDSKIVNLPMSNHNIEVKMQIVICRPEVVDDTTSICDHLKNNIICVVNLEGVDKGNAQRIADFLGGSCYALNGEIQRISNEIFLIAPFNIGISSELREGLKNNGSILPWISSAFSK